MYFSCEEETLVFDFAVVVVVVVVNRAFESFEFVLLALLAVFAKSSIAHFVVAAFVFAVLP